MFIESVNTEHRTYFTTKTIQPSPYRKYRADA